MAYSQTDEEAPNVSKCQTDEHKEHGVNPDTTKKSAFSNLRRDLSDEDMSSPGTQRLLLRDLDNYEECKIKLEECGRKYHEKDKENAVLNTKLMANSSFDILYSVMLSLGAALIGLVPSIQDKDGGVYYLSFVIGGIGLLILGCGIFTRLIKK